MGNVRNITAIALQGRPHSVEYVTEFTISYGYNGLDYADFKEPGGNVKVKSLRQMPLVMSSYSLHFDSMATINVTAAKQQQQKTNKNELHNITTLITRINATQTH